MHKLLGLVCIKYLELSTLKSISDSIEGSLAFEIKINAISAGKCAIHTSIHIMQFNNMDMGMLTLCTKETRFTSII